MAVTIMWGHRDLVLCYYFSLPRHSVPWAWSTLTSHCLLLKFTQRFLGNSRWLVSEAFLWESAHSQSAFSQFGHSAMGTERQEVIRLPQFKCWTHAQMFIEMLCFAEASAAFLRGSSIGTTSHAPLSALHLIDTIRFGKRGHMTVSWAQSLNLTHCPHHFSYSFYQQGFLDITKYAGCCLLPLGYEYKRNWKLSSLLSSYCL